jgi:hypothetical protein
LPSGDRAKSLSLDELFIKFPPNKAALEGGLSNFKTDWAYELCEAIVIKINATTFKSCLVIV